MRKLSELWEGISKWIKLWEGMRKWTELWEGMRTYMKELWYELVVNGVACNHEFLLTFLWFVNLTCTCISSSFASFGTFQYINHIHVNESSL